MDAGNTKETCNDSIEQVNVLKRKLKPIPTTATTPINTQVAFS